MADYRISLNDLPPAGKEFLLDDQAVWEKPMAEFGMECRIVEPLSVRVQLLPVDGGILLRGSVRGSVVLPCNRCSEDAAVILNADFEDFEEQAGEDEESFDADARSAPVAEERNADSRVVYEGAVPMLDLATVCWEEFMLALPVSPLCKADCKGLCPRCGTDLNTGTCRCLPDDGDPRFAVLRGLSARKS